MYILLLIILLLVIIFIVLFNRLIRYKNLMREAWSGIDVQLKRRHDLIPNIVESVKGYMQHERQLFEDITNLRAKVATTATVNE